MGKIIRISFKGLGILSLIIAVGLIGAMFFMEEPSTAEIVENCERNLCISRQQRVTKGSEIFEDCVVRCRGDSHQALGGMWVTPIIGTIFFVVVGIIFLAISAFLGAKVVVAQKKD